MRSIFFTLTMLVSLQWAMSQEVSFTLTVANVQPSSSPSGTITLGAHPSATNGLDTGLGEREIPSLPPPAGVFIIYTVPPIADFIWLSPKDLRRLPIDSSVRHEYDMNVTWTSGRLEISMKQFLHTGIDSAYIVDAITDFPNNFIKVRVDTGMIYTTTNTAIRRLKVLVWYRPGVTGVDDEPTSSLLIAPNPFSDAVTISGIIPGSMIDVYTVDGNIVRSQGAESSSITLQVQDLPVGAYAVRVVDPKGRATQQLMMRR